MPRPVTIGAGQPDRRAGVTLIELLVVLGIMLTLSTLGVVAFTRANRVNRLTATRDLVSDMARQARATARATARPVRLQIREFPNGGSIQGVVQTRLVSAGFETPLLASDPDAFRTLNGCQGQGFILPPGITNPTDPQPLPALERRHCLRATDGFLLSLAVRPPPALGGTRQPLVLLTSGTDDNADTALAGLRLEPITMGLFKDNQPLLVQTPPATDIPWDPTESVWMLQGWLNLDGQRVLISELLCPLDTTRNPTDDDPAKRDLARLTLFRDGGNRWETVGLLWDGENVALLRNNRPIALRQAAGRLPATTDQRLIVGHATFGDWGLESSLNGYPNHPWPAGSTTNTVTPGLTIIDNLELDRLGAQEPHRLPDGVKPTAKIDLFFWPDGSVTKGLEKVGSTDIGLEFTGVAEDVAAKVNFLISPTTGAVTKAEVQPRP